MSKPAFDNVSGDLFELSDQMIEDGTVLTKNEVHSKPLPGVIDIEPQVWHSFVVLEEDTVLFECKKGPYHAETDKTFAPWSPEEGSEEVKEWMESL